MDDRGDIERAEHDWRHDEQLATRRAIFTGCSPFGFAKLFEDTPNRGNIGRAGLCQQKIATRTHHQL